jgi:hypothetical protein
MIRFIFPFLIIICFVNLAKAQNPCRNIDTIVQELGKANYVGLSEIVTGFYNGSMWEEQYIRCKELATCATDEQISQLLNTSQPVIVFYAWHIILSERPDEALKYYFDNRDTFKTMEVRRFLNHCQGYHTYKLDDFMLSLLLEAIIERKLEPTSDEIILLIKHEKANFEAEYKMDVSTIPSCVSDF